MEDTVVRCNGCDWFKHGVWIQDKKRYTYKCECYGLLGVSEKPAALMQRDQGTCRTVNGQRQAD